MITSFLLVETENQLSNHAVYKRLDGMSSKLGIVRIYPLTGVHDFLLQVETQTIADLGKVYEKVRGLGGVLEVKLLTGKER
ncbi:MAG: hypothetical protein ABH829_05790 [archaeon]